MHFGIRLKLLFYTVTIILVVGVSITFYSMLLQQKIIYQELIKNAENQVNLLSNVLVDPLYQYRVDKINTILSEVKQNKEVNSIYALNTKQQILTDGKENRIFYNEQLPNLNSFFHEIKNSKSTVAKINQDNFLLGKAIRTPNNEIVGYIVIDISTQKANDAIRSTLLQTFVIFIGLILLGSASVIVLTYYYLKPIVKMTEDMRLISAGDLDHSIKVTATDERGLLAVSINKMVESLKKINEATARFVPNEFLSLLSKKDIGEVKLGDCVQKNVSVIFADIVKFTTLSEKMSPQESFEYVNNLLYVISPVIAKHGGFIDKYIGDAIMAIFTAPPNQAVECGIDMLKVIKKFNQTSAKIPVRIGIGLNSGDALLGIVGSENRIEGTVISSAVNAAARIEAMTRYYKVDFLISEDTYHRLIKPSQFAIRMIDKVQLRGMEKHITLYEVFEADSPNQKDYKLRTKKQFEEAVQMFHAGERKKSHEVFTSLFEKDYEDPIVNYYLQQGLHLVPDNPVTHD